MNFDVNNWSNLGRFDVTFSVKQKRFVSWKMPNCFWVVRRDHELTAVIFKLSSQRHHEMPDVRRRHIVVWFVPKAEQRSISEIGSENESANDETFLPVREEFKRHFDSRVVPSEKDIEASRLSADILVFDFQEVVHKLLNETRNSRVRRRRLCHEFRKPFSEVCDLTIGGEIGALGITGYRAGDGRENQHVCEPLFEHTQRICFRMFLEPGESDEL
ncbi:MAG: hypothetical protein WEB58_05120 [Planctomycetaceae bacterium]